MHSDLWSEYIELQEDVHRQLCIDPLSQNTEFPQFAHRDFFIDPLSQNIQLPTGCTQRLVP